MNERLPGRCARLRTQPSEAQRVWIAAFRPRTLPAVRPSIRSPWSAVLCSLLAACGADSQAAGSGADELAAPDRFEFVDVAGEAGVTLVNASGDPRRWYIPESNGNGAAWLDHDGDGDMDLFVGNGQGLRYEEDGARLVVERVATSALYRNDTEPGTGLRFRDVSEVSGAARSEWMGAVATGDVDADGDPDLYLANFDPDVLLVNAGGRFEDGTQAAGLGSPHWGAGAAFGDPDNDGDLDLYVSNYVRFDLDAPPDGGKRQVYEGVEIGYGPIGENKQGFNPGAPDLYYENDGRGVFREVSGRVGLELDEALCSYAAVFSDVDGDGWQDLLVANDLEPCNLFMNQGDGRFVEEGVERGFAFGGEGQATAAMGLMVDDVDGDGDQDVLRTNFDFEANALHLNDGRGNFREVAGGYGLAEPSVDRLGWGGSFFDADLDGDLDLFVANGHVLPQAKEIGMSGWAMGSQLFENTPRAGGAPSFADVTAGAGADLGRERSSRGVAFADADDDGDLDFVVIDLDGPPRLFENRTPHRGRWLSVRTVGTTSNRDGYGARVSVTAGGRTQVREARTNQGLYSASDPRLHFGLGPVEAVERVEVRWPSGRVSLVEGPALDAVLVVTEPEESNR